jgi:hypothetical protein
MVLRDELCSQRERMLAHAEAGVGERMQNSIYQDAENLASSECTDPETDALRAALA